ncbi:hypothetical protein RJT34_01745 [Clitoria ternatea]|uniref:Uncharacterized protein n=1 Tax=Clitoria ternatea TaxID=43366 RepID=A0AAN9Q0M6_CLITE
MFPHLRLFFLLFVVRGIISYFCVISYCFKLFSHIAIVYCVLRNTSPTGNPQPLPLHEESSPKATYKSVTVNMGFALDPQQIIKFVNLNPEIKIGLEEYERLCVPWKPAFIVKLFDR